MRFSPVIAASLVAPLVAAHGDHIPGAPKIFGLRSGLSKLSAKAAFNDNAKRVPAPAPHQLNARQGGADGRCGAAFGGASCDAGYCCSSAGWCGQGYEFCFAPDCQFEYGPACDANNLPSGGSTRPISRSQLGAVPYGGEGIYDCVEPGTVAITYDDGPYIYTNDVLDQFAAYGFKATFFITGINIGKGAIDDESQPWPAVVRRMIAEGHQVASHTWSHQNLDQITQEQRIDQMVKNEMAISNIIGKFPTYMRPPYSACSAASGCPDDMRDLGYVVSYFDLDTDDYNNITPELVQNAKDRFANAINPSNPASDEFLAIAHDIHQQTAQNLTGYMLDLMVSKGYRGVTMGECMGEPEANWYRAGNGRVPTSSPTASTASSTASSTGSATSSAPTATGTAASVDGTCGSANGFHCIGWELGECCSPAGWCGNTVDHCGTGCQSGFGNCGGSSSSSSAASSTTTTSTSDAGSSTSSTASSSAPTSTPTGNPVVDGTCGPTNGGNSCIGWALGECCSQYGWCGNTADHCGTGCQSAFGDCSGGADSSSSSEVAASSTETSSAEASSTESATETSTEASTTETSASVTETPSSTPSTTPTPTSSTPYKPTPTGKKSVYGQCGGRKGNHCLGYEHGECCSRHGWCGSTKDHCKQGCNPLFGNCGAEYVKQRRPHYGGWH